MNAAPARPGFDWARFLKNRRILLRQSSWMIFAHTLGGVMLVGIHFAMRKVDSAEYGVFAALLQALNLMIIPAMGLQSVFAQQTAAMMEPAQRQDLAATARGVLRALVILWCLIALGLLVFHRQVLDLLQIRQPAALWVTLFIGLGAMVLPILQGIVQGMQNFVWLGWSFMLNGAGRFVFIYLLVVLLGGESAAGMTGVLLGTLGAIAIAGWKSWPMVRVTGGAWNWREWMGRVIPLTFGLGSTVVLMSADMLVVQSTFAAEQTGAYGAAGVIARGIYFLTLPLTTVMFPKVVQSSLRGEQNDALVWVMMATAACTGSVALFCTLFPAVPFQLIYGGRYLEAAPLLPWFCWGMVPLAMSTVLVNGLMARGRFAVVPWISLAAAGYFVALTRFNHSFFSVICTLITASLLLLAITGWFTWRSRFMPFAKA